MRPFVTNAAPALIELKKMIADRKFPQKPTVYTDTEDAWKEMCQRDDLDLIYIATPWELHTPMAVLRDETRQARGG